MVVRRIALLAAIALLAMAGNAQAAFPGQNGKIAFVSNRDAQGTGNLDIYTMNSDGGDVTRLTTDPLPEENPEWSADGSQIAFEGSRNDSSAIVVMNADGTGERTITGPGYFYPTGNPAWSPDGQKIVFQGNTGSGNVELYVIGADGSGLTRLTNTSESELSPSWSPDGSKIAFSRFVPPCTAVVCNFEIFVMNADGSGETRLTFDSDQDTDPNWSPDGRKITWGNLDGHTDIQVMNADGSGQTGFSPPATGYQPAWSPDGQKIVWSGIKVMTADGTDQHGITHAGAFDVQPDWQPLNRAPDCSGVSADPSLLWPPNRRFRVVELAGASDPDGDDVTLEITGVTQDEPVIGGRDAFGATDNLVRLRAERDSHADGRVYQVGFTVTDSRGARCEGIAKVAVPRHRRRAAVDSAPPSYDSFGP